MPSCMLTSMNITNLAQRIMKPHEQPNATNDSPYLQEIFIMTSLNGKKEQNHFLFYAVKATTKSWKVCCPTTLMNVLHSRQP